MSNTIEFAADQIPELNSQRIEPTAPISLADARLEPPEGMVAYIEDLLKQARSGKVRGLVIGVVYQGRNISHGLGPGDAMWADLYLSTARLQHALLDEMNRCVEEG